MSIYHLQSAISNSKEVKRIETEYSSYSGDPPEEDDVNIIVKHRSLTISSIISTICFLESIINEFYDAILQHAEDSSPMVSHSSLNGIEESAIGTEGIQQISNLDAVIGGDIQRNMPAMKKYQLLLSLSGSEIFEKGQNPWQDVNTVRRLRNYLVHYSPEEYSVEISNTKGSDITHDLGSALQGKFDENPLMSDHQPYFPNKVLSYGCTRWSITSTVNFTDEFFNRLDQEPAYGNDGSIGLEQYMR